MIVTTSVRALSWNDNLRACALAFLYNIHYVNSDLRRHFLIYDYGIFPSLRRTISYPRNMSVYALFIYFYFSFVSTLYLVLSLSFSTLDSIISPPVSMLDSISSWFDLTLTAFPTRSLVEGGPIWRVSTCFRPIITSRNFANRDPCRDLVKKSASMCSVIQYTIDILLLSTLSLKNK